MPVGLCLSLLPAMGGFSRQFCAIHAFRDGSNNQVLDYLAQCDNVCSILAVSCWNPCMYILYYIYTQHLWSHPVRNLTEGTFAARDAADLL